MRLFANKHQVTFDKWHHILTMSTWHQNTNTKHQWFNTHFFINFDVEPHKTNINKIQKLFFKREKKSRKKCKLMRFEVNIKKTKKKIISVNQKIISNEYANLVDFFFSLSLAFLTFFFYFFVLSNCFLFLLSNQNNVQTFPFVAYIKKVRNHRKMVMYLIWNCAVEQM